MEAIKYFFAAALDAAVAILFAKTLAACIKGFLKNRRSSVESIEATVLSKTCDAKCGEVSVYVEEPDRLMGSADNE